jgi:hypothetical protein
MLYFIQAEGVGHIKIGFTADDDAAARLATLQTGSPVPLKLLGTVPGTMDDEKNLHRRFASSKVHGEWFKPVPDLVAIIPPTVLPMCGSVQVVEQTVSIRVLTVGRKQFSKALLEQLPRVTYIDWEDAVTWVRETHKEEAKTPHPKTLNEIAHELELQGSPFVYSVPLWGWLAVDPKWRWLIFESDSLLYKSKDYFNFQDVPLKAARDILALIYDTRYSLPGFSDEDQLFFGV